MPNSRTELLHQEPRHPPHTPNSDCRSAGVPVVRIDSDRLIARWRASGRMATRPFESTLPRCHLAGTERRLCIRPPQKEVQPTQPALLAQWQGALSSRTFGENRPDLAQEPMTRFPIDKRARMIRAMLAQFTP